MRASSSHHPRIILTSSSHHPLQKNKEMLLLRTCFLSAPSLIPVSFHKEVSMCPQFCQKPECDAEVLISGTFQCCVLVSFASKRQRAHYLTFELQCAAAAQ